MPDNNSKEKLEHDLDNECKINHILLLDKINTIEETVSKLKRSLEDRTNDISELVESFKRVQRIAEDAKRLSSEISHTQASVYEAMKSHIASLDHKIVDFEVLLKKGSEENKIQNENLNKKIDTVENSLSTLNKTSIENYNNFNNKIDILITSDSERTNKENTEKALKEADEKRLDTFWKRLPVWLSICIAFAAFSVWLINAVLVMYGKK